MFFKSKKLVGLDIGSSSIKMAELEVGRQGAKLLSLGLIPTPPGAFNYGDILDQNSLSSAIRQLVQNFKIKRKYVSSGLAGTSVIVKKITIPKIERKLLADQVRWEAEQYIPFDVNSIALTYHVIESTKSSDVMDLLLIASQIEVVSNYSQVIAGAGLESSVLDVMGFALANLFEFNYGKRPGKTIGLLNIGATTTNFVVVHDGDILFSRDINVGGQSYTYEIHKELGLSVVEAEAMKLGAVRGDGVPDEVHSLMSSVTTTIKEEIRNNFDYFSGSSGSLSLSHCFFTGGASGTPGLIEGISQATGVSMEALNPYVRILPSSKTVSPAYLDQVSTLTAGVLGLALRKTGDA